MRGAFVIAGKDLRNLFMSPLFYIVTGVCALAWSFLFYFSVGEFVSQSVMSRLQNPTASGEGGSSLHFTVIAKHISLVNLFLIFSIAALTMRLFSEEKRQRTYDLLLTSPVTATEIALGKLMAGVGTAWVLVFVSFLYPVSLSIWAQLEWGPLLSAYLGLLFLAATYTAIGMFASSLTESAVISVLMSLFFNVMLWFIGAAADANDNPTSREVLEHLNVAGHFVSFWKGNPSLSGLVFFGSMIFLFTFLTQRVVESTRWK